MFNLFLAARKSSALCQHGKAESRVAHAHLIQRDDARYLQKLVTGTVKGYTKGELQINWLRMLM